MAIVRSATGIGDGAMNSNINRRVAKLEAVCPSGPQGIRVIFLRDGEEEPPEVPGQKTLCVRYVKTRQE
jgi:hypothetical protein